MTRRIIALLTTGIMTLTAMAQLKCYTLQLGDFKDLTVSSDINVVYRQSADSAGMATYTCSADKASALEFTPGKGKLKIELAKDRADTPDMPTVTVYSTTLRSVTNLGDSTVTVNMAAPVNDITAKVIGNGYIRLLGVDAHKLTAAVEAGSGHVFLSGRTTQAKLRMAGVGALEASSLESDDTSCWVFLNGTIDCCAASKLNVYGASSGTIYYKGDPAIKNRCVGIHLVCVSE